MNYEDRLKAYRRKKAMESIYNRVKSAFDFSQKDQEKRPVLDESEEDERGEVPDKSELLGELDCIDVQSVSSDDSISISWSKKDVLWFILRLSLWGSLYYLAIKVEFGTVFLAISALIFIYYNTRTGQKKRGEVSAYSIFNKNCQPIDGTLQAEQLQREMLGGFLYHLQNVLEIDTRRLTNTGGDYFQM
ncbi:uncharacterized protein LOC106665331 [Cimex lectularius]|uniref:SAYSvFN domain-containing protein n=1 Tax=Cimex lectularius TaxID=79782 RepID=A0A8I6RNH3_CIMLE|nr:uncharacterized protein LOC106665331 [Cimex lectularius]